MTDELEERARRWFKAAGVRAPDEVRLADESEWPNMACVLMRWHTKPAFEAHCWCLFEELHAATTWDMFASRSEDDLLPGEMVSYRPGMGDVGPSVKVVGGVWWTRLVTRMKREGVFG